MHLLLLAWIIFYILLSDRPNKSLKADPECCLMATDKRDHFPPISGSLCRLHVRGRAQNEHRSPHNGAFSEGWFRLAP